MNKIIPNSFFYLCQNCVGIVYGILTNPQAGRMSCKIHSVTRRWIIEKTFSQLENFRRLTVDCEFKADTTEAMV